MDSVYLGCLTQEEQEDESSHRLVNEVGAVCEHAEPSQRAVSENSAQGTLGMSESKNKNCSVEKCDPSVSDTLRDRTVRKWRPQNQKYGSSQEYGEDNGKISPTVPEKLPTVFLTKQDGREYAKK